MSNLTYNFEEMHGAYFSAINCDHLVEVWHYLRYNLTRDPDHGIVNGNMDDIYNYIIEGLENYLKFDSLQPPPKTQKFWDWSVGLFEKVTLEGVSECKPQMCNAIGWEGSPDLAGVGMLATYTIQAILVTFYLFSILELRLNWLPLRLRKSRMISRTLLSVQHSIAEFLSASSIFSLSLLVASIHSTTQADSVNPSIAFLILIIPLNSIFPAIILNVIASSMLRRSKGRVILWLVIDLLVIALIILCFTIFSKISPATISIYGVEIWWDEHPCIETSLSKTYYFSLAVTGVLILGITAYIVDFIVSIIRHRPGLVVRLPKMVQWGVITASFCTMWYFLAWFIDLTTQIRSRTGENNNDSKWTFGQVLALATWIPFMVEFAYIWWEEPLQALNGRLMAPYEVVATSEQESLLEMASSRGDEDRGRFQRL